MRSGCTCFTSFTAPATASSSPPRNRCPSTSTLPSAARIPPAPRFLRGWPGSPPRTRRFRSPSAPDERSAFRRTYQPGVTAVDLTLSRDQEDLRARARAVAAGIMEHEESCEEANGLSADTHARIADLVREHALNAVNMPAAWGGQGLGVLDQVLVQEELGQLTNALWDTVWRPANALRACTASQREESLLPAIRGERRDCFAVTEEGAGSDPARIATTAERVDGGFRIDGEKWFVTVGDVADFLIVLALVMPERAPTLFLIDKDLPGVRVLRTPRYMHTFVYEHPEFGFEDVRVPETAVLGEIGSGYDLTRDWFVEERLMIAARSVGAAERALRSAVDWASASSSAKRSSTTS